MVEPDPLTRADVVRVAAWERYPWLRAGFSARHGGVSSVYGSSDMGGALNLGWTVEDDTLCVAENRRRFVAEVMGQPAGGRISVELVTLRQVHGVDAQMVRRDGQPLQTDDGRPLLVGDGMMTAESGLLLGVQTADCVPVLVADTRLRVVAAFHAGWRGTVAAIVAQGIAQMKQEFGCRAEDLTAAIGPCIRSCCFAVGTEVRERFTEQFPYAVELFEERTEGTARQLFADLQTANRQQLLASGLVENVIHVVPACTACARTESGARRYFSHRAERGVTGRMMNAIGVVAQG